MLETILISLLTGLVGLLIGHRLRLGGDSEAKRKRFRSYLLRLRTQMEAKHHEFYFKFPETTFSEFDRETLEVHPHIRDKNKFDSMCAAYKQLEFSIQNSEKNKVSKAKLLSILDELLDFAR